jgi:hypothetical protein
MMTAMGLPRGVAFCLLFKIAIEELVDNANDQVH